MAAVVIPGRSTALVASCISATTLPALRILSSSSGFRFTDTTLRRRAGRSFGAPPGPPPGPDLSPHRPPAPDLSPGRPRVPDLSPHRPPAPPVAVVLDHPDQATGHRVRGARA